MGGSLVRCKRKRFERTRQAGSSKLASRLLCASTPERPLASSVSSPRTTLPNGPLLQVCLLCLLLTPVEFEWFDSQGNSLGFAPKLNLSPPRQPLPPPPPPSAPPILSVPFSSSSSPLPSPDSPTSSSDLPPPPPPSPVCTHCAGKEAIKDSLDAIKRAIEDVKGAINEMQHREEEQTRHEEHLMTLLQDLRQVISDTGALSRDTAQDRRHEQRLDPSSG
jgi:hypothetical protein